MLMLSAKSWIGLRSGYLKRKGGRPPADKREAIAGIFGVLDNGANWKDLPALSAPRAPFIAGGFRLYECFIDGTFSKNKSGGDGIGCTRVSKGAKIMILVDAKGLRGRVQRVLRFLPAAL